MGCCVEAPPRYVGRVVIDQPARRPSVPRGGVARRAPTTQGTNPSSGQPRRHPGAVPRGRPHGRHLAGEPAGQRRAGSPGGRPCTGVSWYSARPARLPADGPSGLIAIGRSPCWCPRTLRNRGVEEALPRELLDQSPPSHVWPCTSRAIGTTSCPSSMRPSPMASRPARCHPSPAAHAASWDGRPARGPQPRTDLLARPRPMVAPPVRASSTPCPPRSTARSHA